MPGPGLFSQADGLAACPIAFGDGMPCASTGISRMSVVFPVSGSASCTGGLTPNPIHIAGASVHPRDLKHRQSWYRDSPVFCAKATFNTSSGVSPAWLP